MADIDQIVQVTITQQTTAVPQAGFGIPLIVGDTNVFGGDLIRYYSSLSAVGEDFETTDPEYIYAQKAFSQALSPEQIAIGYSDFGDIAADLEAIMEESNLWYGISLCTQTDAVILAAAAWVETQEKILIADSDEAAILTTATSDIASALKLLGYDRTALVYSGDADQGPSAGWLGGQLPQVPGSSTWKFKQLDGITPDTFTSTQRNIAIGVPGTPGKNVNIYETVGGVAITQNGTMAGGDWIDVTIGLDWLKSRLQENVYSVLVNAAKVPFTNAGIALIVNAVRQTLNQALANGLIDADFEVTAPDVLDVSAADRANRILPDVTFTARLAGAIQTVEIEGTVSV